MLRLMLMAVVISCIGAAYAGEVLIKNGDFSKAGGSVWPAGWRGPDKDVTVGLDKADLPAGVVQSVKVTLNKSAKFQGYFAQRIRVTPSTPKKFQVVGYVRSEVASQAFIQVKLRKGKKELARISSKSSKTGWTRVSVQVEVGEAESMDILCRWQQQERFLGKSCWFAGVMVAPAAKSVALVGDSIVQDYPLSSNRRGWGQVLPKFLQEGVLVQNFAIGGRSTKTFLENKDWQRALNSGADYIFIQFGHNDSHEPGRPESTEAAGEYCTNLAKFVAEAKAAGITPVLITPPHRRVYGKSGKLSQTLSPYAKAMKGVASDSSVACVDLYSMTEKVFMDLGEDGSKPLFCSVKDRSHFSEHGALMLSAMIAGSLKAQSPELAGLMLEQGKWPISEFYNSAR